MKNLPRLMRFAPTMFYVIASVSLFFGILLPLIELSKDGFSTDLPTPDGLVRSIVFKHVARQLVEASYIYANGVVIHLLIAIWDKIGMKKAEAVE